LKNLEDEIKKIFFKLGSEIIVHKVDGDTYIIDIDYDKYTIQMMELFKGYLEE